MLSLITKRIQGQLRKHMENHSELKSIKRVEVSLVLAWKINSFSYTCYLFVRMGAFW